MVRQAYGQSWWGQQWLNALAHIDDENRLPRGRTYANKGAISDLDIDKGAIRATVKGSMPWPYQVRIDVPAIASADQEKLLDAIAGEPFIIAKLLNRELDPAVLDLANRLNIQLFPRRWSDLHMDCSCPDWAVPCKHLAAVIYQISRSIDGDPFQAFALRGIDLLDELEERGVHASRQTQVSLPNLAQLLNTPKTDRTELSDSARDALDFSRIPPLADALPRLLSPSPVFYARGDFRAVYIKYLDRVIKSVQRQCTTLQTEPARFIKAKALSAQDKPVIELDTNYAQNLQGMADISNWPQLCQALHHCNPEHLDALQPEVAALYQVYLYALHLLANGAVMAQVFTGHGTQQNNVHVRWLPALQDKTVAALADQLGRLLPEGMVRFASDKKTPHPLRGQTQAITLCSLLLDHLIHDAYEPANKTAHDDKLLALFFGKGQAQFDQLGESTIASGIAQWLSRLTLAQRAQTPVLALDESGNDFALHIALKLTPDQVVPTPLKEVIHLKRHEKIRFEALQTVSTLAEFFPPLNAYLNSGAQKPLPLMSEVLPAFLFDALPAIRLLGIQALLPKTLEVLLRPQLSLAVKSKQAADSAGFLKIDDLFSFDWQIALGEHLISVREFEKLVKNAHGIIQFKGQYIYLDPADIERLRANLAKPPALSGMALLQTSLAEQYQGAPIQLDTNARALLRRMTEVENIPLPTGLTATLRPYQQRGFAWLAHNLGIGLGGVIADDMGLGKTLQVIAAILHLKENGHLADAKALVVVPTTLLSNWQREITRFAPGLTTDIYHGNKRALAEERPDVLLTTYGVARTEAAALKKLSWRLVVADEAQNIKNAATAQTKALKGIPAQSFIAMSGTPVENRLSEYWSIMDFAQRGYLGNLNHFVKTFARPIQTDHDQTVVDRFRRVTAPFLLRRLKSDKTIISDLPDKIETDQFCELTARQTAVYESVVREGMRVIRGQSDAFQRQGLVLQMIMALKQVCNHPVQYLKSGKKDAELSGKAQLLFDLLDGIYETPDKVLIFTQFKEMGDLLTSWIGERTASEPLFLHGGLSRKKRDELVERFQNDRTARVFILSLKAGGTGLNLTAANHVIHYDLWWNPAVEAQATDRAYRIGQHRNVQVHRLLTRATFEERINDMIKAKKTLAELTVGTGENWIGKMNDAELDALFSVGLQKS